ncbi:MAG TPA: tetratricopeptide repeat protein [Phototrophicaceae bacterium]|nr:tetratricopeptide repeat protein [Phototrophicaceae bacterium]
MFKRGLSLLLLALLMMNAVGNISGQEPVGRETKHYIYIKVTNNTFQPQYDLLANLTFVAAQLQLLKHNVYFRPVSSDQTLDFTIWNIDDKPSISITTYQSPISEIYPFLGQFSESMSHVDIVPGNPLKTYLNAIRLTTAMSFYQSSLCNEANSLFNGITAKLVPQKGQNYSIDSTLSSIYFYQANCSIANQNFEVATNQLDTSLDLNLGKYREITIGALRISYYLAWVYLQTGREEEALLLLQNLTEEARRIPGSGDAYNDVLINSAQIYALASHYKEAVENLNTVIERFNENIPSQHLLRGQMYLALYEWDSALADYNAALELDPDYADAYFYRGLLYYSILQTGTDLRDDALADFRRYLELAPTGAHAAEAAHSIATIQAELDALNN